MSKFLNISTDNTLGGNNASNEVVSSQKAIKDYVDNNSSTYTAGTGIDITNDVISVAAPTLVNKATQTDSVAILTNSTNSAHNTVAIGYAAYCPDYSGVAVGTNTQGSYMATAVGGSAKATGEGSVALGIDAKASGNYSIQLGKGTNSEANSFYVGTSSSNNWKMLDSAGLIPEARISSNIARTSSIPTVDQTYDGTSTNAQSGVAVAQALSSVSVSKDNLSITNNSNNQLQTVGVIDQNDTTQAIKTWTGTLAQYNAIVTKDADTLYNITDDTAGGSSVYTKSEVDSLISNFLTNETTSASSKYVYIGDLLIQWGVTSVLSVPAYGDASANISLQKKFSNSNYTVLVSHYKGGGGYAATIPNTTGHQVGSFTIHVWGQNGAGTTQVAWIAIGKRG